ncbi:MAG: transglycosylase SLT domain-containing protein [Armatimonadia bacterium]|nr:transglycosylase SLT domain-containing protein [Armatimonadia bacterium]
MQRIDAIAARLDGLAGPRPERARPGAFAETLSAASAQPRPVAPGSGRSGDYDGIIRNAAAANNLSPDLIHAVVRAESDYNPRCRSSAGAMGLMQLMPGTARALGVSNPWDPAQNVAGGARYLREQMDRFGDLTLALAAYNAGPGAVRRYDGVPPYEETQTYVRRVQRYLQERMAGR